MPEQPKMPDGMTGAHLNFLNIMRMDGQINMFGAAIPLKEAYGLDQKTANKYVRYCMDNFKPQAVE